MQSIPNKKTRRFLCYLLLFSFLTALASETSAADNRRFSTETICAEIPHTSFNTFINFENPEILVENVTFKTGLEGDKKKKAYRSEPDVDGANRASEHKILTSKKSYTLHLILQDSTYDTAQQERLKNVFFTVYPKLVKEYNKKSPKTVTITIDTAYDGVAYAHDGKVVISQAWLKKMPEDIDVVTHEVMHIIQSYPSRSGPGWLVEGIADYARDKYGVNNAAANWSLPDVKENHHYTNSYRIAARFLKWVEEEQKKGFIKKLDKALRDKTYDDTIWAKNTRKSLDELWDMYKVENLKN